MCELFINADPALWKSKTRSLRISGVVTSIRLERYFWSTLEEIARRDQMNVPQMVTQLYYESVEVGHDLENFTSFLRVCCIRYLALQVSGDIPLKSSIPISSLDASSILEKENFQLTATT